ncbi:MAG: penicillin-binding protein [Candidatus Acidiferrales bacterium]
MRAAPAASKTRLVFLGVVACLWLGLLLARLVDLQIIRHHDLAQRAQRQQQRTLEITPKRGVIYDRQGRELAVSIGVDSVFAIPGEVADPVSTARRLAKVLETDATVLEGRLRTSRSFVWLERKLDNARAERLQALDLPGIYTQKEFKRFYPKRELAAHVLGFVGLDENGLAGIEYSLDAVIRGRPRKLVITADGRRRWFERQNEVPSEGASVALTIDENIQYIAEQELAAAMARTQAARGTVIVQDTRTGEILALANRPTFNPNLPTAVPASSHVNQAVTLAYEPGSTFKVVTIAAALEERVTNPREVIDCQQGAIYIAGHRIRDHKPFGHLTLQEVMQESSDVGAIKVGLRLGNEKMYEHIRRWRFGRATGIELPAESRGMLRPAGNWSRISIGAVSMGQEVAITSLQLISAISTIGNGGAWVQPHVVREIIRGESREQVSPQRRERIIPEEVAEELRTMLTRVVTLGTGRTAQPAGYSAAGKTGTAQKIDSSGRYSSSEFIASFAGFAPAQAPIVSVAVVLDSPRGRQYHGGEVAAPVFAKVTERVLAYLNVPKNQPLPRTRWAPPLERAAMQDLRPGQFDSSVWADEALPAETPPVVAQPAVRKSRESAPGSLLPPPEAAPAGAVVLLNGDSVVVPDLTGLSLRAAMQECTGLGLEPVLVGSGLATAQRPAPGTRVPRGSRIWVEFRPTLPAAPTRTM